MTAQARMPTEMLLVEDNRGDARLAMEALKLAEVGSHVHHVRDGVEALQFLRREAAYSAAPRPDLVLLDWNMPRKTGPELLAEIKQDDSLRRIPVVVLTISSNENDVRRAYDLHANCYITKPLDLGEFLKVVRSIKDFWLTVVRLPPDGAP
jgi:CheY-like chemotaxis protein